MRFCTNRTLRSGSLWVTHTPPSEMKKRVSNAWIFSSAWWFSCHGCLTMWYRVMCSAVSQTLSSAVRFTTSTKIVMQHHKIIDNMSESLFLTELAQQAHKWKSNPPNGSHRTSWLCMTIGPKAVEISRKIVPDFLAFCRRNTEWLFNSNVTKTLS